MGIHKTFSIYDLGILSLSISSAKNICDMGFSPDWWSEDDNLGVSLRLKGHVVRFKASEKS